jgi:hypothetical protein
VVGAQLVKFVTAIETILVTKNEPNLAEALSRRAAAFVNRVDGVPVTSTYDRMKSTYDLRSQIVHGNTASLDAVRLGKAVVRAESLSRDVLCAALQIFGRQGLTAEKVSLKNIEKNYAGIVSSVWPPEAPAAVTDP